MKFELPELPYERTALEPHISSETIDYHYGKHHQAYVNNLNTLIKESELEDLSLEDIILKAEGAVFNNAAQVWNHTFYFLQFSRKPQTAPQGELAAAINAEFGNIDTFKEIFEKSGATLFGSGWVWLVKTAKGDLQLRQTTNAANPLTLGETPLLTCDVWEHAYYLDFQNRRPDYLSSFWEILDWAAIEQRFFLIRHKQ